MTQSTKRQHIMTVSRDALHGLSLPPAVLRGLEKRGIYCIPSVTVEHQHLAKRYVLRGVESGGAVVDMGRACGFVSLDGLSLPWLQKIDSIAVNGRHAIVISENFVRVEMLRVGLTCELAISHHSLTCPEGTNRPRLVSRFLFRGRDGALPIELWKQEHRQLRDRVSPLFYSRAGEIVQPPKQFEDVVQKLSTAVCCIGCTHTHIGISPTASNFIAP